jgi:peptidyl-prolyl cis-trans isomerase-like 2
VGDSPVHYFVQQLTRVCVRYQDPFQEYKERQDKKRAKKAEGDAHVHNKQSVRKNEGEMNWFGEKVGGNKPAVGTVGGGVGKYLQQANTVLAKRPVASSVPSTKPEEPKKKRKIGFGEFDGW